MGRQWTLSVMTKLSGVAFLLWALSATAFAQDPPAPEDSPSATVKLDLPEDVELKVLVKYVSERIGINLLYDESVASKKITLRAATPIPVQTLLPLLESALHSKGLALIEDEATGWKRIVDATTLPEHARPVEPGGISDDEVLRPATQAFVLKTIPAQRADQIIKPFLSKPGGASLANDESRVLIVTDFGTNLRRVQRLLDWVDQPIPAVTLEFVDIKNVAAGELASQLTQFMAARLKASGPAAGSPINTLEIASDERTNQIVLIGTEPELAQAKTLIEKMDVPVTTRTETYTFRYVAAERVDRLVKQMMSPLESKRRYSSAIDAEANLLIVTTTPEIHQRVLELQKRMDVVDAEPQSPMRFYQLRNASVDEVLATIRSIEGGQRPETQNEGQEIRRRMSEQRSPPPGPNYGPPIPGAPPTSPPVFQPMSAVEPAEAATSAPGDQAIVVPAVMNTEQNALTAFGNAQITSDPNTNTLIVVAPPEVQRIYADLIKRLDRRRPQVLIEITIVTVDCNDQFTFGVEFSGGDREGLKRLFAFTSFGLSQVNPVTGALSIIPGRGFNGTLVDPSVADAVLRALATHSKARVLAAPRVLVNDNATGVLTSVNEFPFSSVNASNTVATTSFGGFTDAGTTITVTPRIAEGDHLQMNFTAELSSFTGAASGGLPPPRQNNGIESDVTIPDGYTVILGGLKFTNSNWRQETIPFLEHIPIIEQLVSLYNTSSATTQIYFFVKPVILRDDEFRVLKHYSDRDVVRARIKPNFPSSEPSTGFDDARQVTWDLDESCDDGPMTETESLDGFPESEPLLIPQELPPEESVPTLDHE